MKKFLILGILFALPITAYLFFALGENNFSKLPVLTKNVKSIDSFSTPSSSAISFDNKISVVAFFGRDLDKIKGNTFNLDKKILEKYYQFNDFQFVIILPEGTENQVAGFVEEFKNISNSQVWKFVFASAQQIEEVFKSLNSPYKLSENSYSPFVFIVDKDANLRGRKIDKNEKEVYGYDSRNVAELNNKMNDDLKIVLAEYRLALKKNNAYKVEKED